MGAPPIQGTPLCEPAQLQGPGTTLEAGDGRINERTGPCPHAFHCLVRKCMYGLRGLEINKKPYLMRVNRDSKKIREGTGSTGEG